MFYKELRAQTSSTILSMRQARQKNNLERFFFSFRVDFYCQEASCRKTRKETEKLIEASYRYCSSIQNDSNNMYHEGVIYSKVLNFKQEALKGSLKKRGY